MNARIDREVLVGFIDEVGQYLPEIRSGLGAAQANPRELQALEQIHRLVHTIKGAASMIGLPRLAQMASLLEEAIEELAAGRLPAEPATFAVLLQATDGIGVYTASLQSGAPDDGAVVEPVLLAFGSLRGHAIPESDWAAPPPAGLTSTGRQSKPGPLPGADSVELSSLPEDVAETFRQESEELLQRVGSQLQIVTPSGDAAALLEIRRDIHTLKGAAASVGVTRLSQLAHRMEDLLDGIHDGDIPFSEDARSLLFTTFDCLTDISAGNRDAALNGDIASVYERYAALLDSPSADAPSARPEPVSVPEPSADLLDTFRQEADEILRDAGRDLRALDQSPAGDSALAQEIRRGMHRLKGAAGLIGLTTESNLAQRTQLLLDAAIEGRLSLKGEARSLLFQAVDALDDRILGDGEVDAASVVGQIDALLAVAGGGTAHPEPCAPAELPPLPILDLTGSQPAQPEPEEKKYTQYVRVPIEKLDDIVRLVSELVVNRSTFEQHNSGLGNEIDELGLSVQRLKRVSSRLDADFEVSALGGFGQLAVRAMPMPSVAKSAEFDTLEFDRYTDFHLVSRDLSETTSDLSAAAGGLSDRVRDFESCLNRLGQLTSEAQDKLMRLRMVPLLSLATRLHRTVRVTAERCGKQAELVIEGERVELDKTLMEEMAGPLEHLLRNAIDHGIEEASLRQVLGKPGRGKIRIRALHEGTQVVIQVSDDGAGLEPGLLRAAAVRCGLYSDLEAAQLSPPELNRLIFHPGFSTARQVSETSGRGVGMDVVRSTVDRLRGTVSIESEIGQGTTFTVRLPMTLAIMRVLLVKTCGETFAIPLSVVAQILRLEQDQLERVGNEEVLRVEGRVLPARHLGELLKLKQPPDRSVRRRPVLVLNIGDRKIAILVDRIEEAREVVVKTLGNTLRRVRGVAGATLMGDGSVVLIVNPSDLVQHEETRPTPNSAPAAPLASRTAYDILIVDDSVSVRKILSNVVRGNGWNAHTAKDGLEALEFLQHGVTQPDAILLDIEMPRMDGYELTAALRSLEAFRNTPIVMLTSRAGEKHRAKAFELGVTDYLVKPYQEDTLLTVIRRVVRERREAPVA